MHFKRALVALLLSVTMLIVCNGRTAAVPAPTDWTSTSDFRLSEHVRTPPEIDPQFQRSQLVLAENQAQAMEAAEEAAATEAARQAEQSHSLLRGNGPIWSFDDCDYGNGHVQQFITVLKQHGVPGNKAIFFLTGNCVQAETGIDQLIWGSGYQVGNHTKSHLQLTTGPPSFSAIVGPNWQAVVRDQIENGPHGTRYWRPPYCATNDQIDQFVWDNYHLQALRCWPGLVANVIDSQDYVSIGKNPKHPVYVSCQFVLNRLRQLVTSDSVVMLHLQTPYSPAAVSAYLSGYTTC